LFAPRLTLTLISPCKVGCVAEMAASRKKAKYATLQTHYDFQPIVGETLGPINESTTSYKFV